MSRRTIILIAVGVLVLIAVGFSLFALGRFSGVAAVTGNNAPVGQLIPGCVPAGDPMCQTGWSLPAAPVQPQIEFSGGATVSPWWTFGGGCLIGVIVFGAVLIVAYRWISAWAIARGMSGDQIFSFFRTARMAEGLDDLDVSGTRREND